MKIWIEHLRKFIVIRDKKNKEKILKQIYKYYT